MSDEKNVHVLAIDPAPGEHSGPERFVSCDFCGFKGQPTADLDALAAETLKHGAGVCA